MNTPTAKQYLGHGFSDESDSDQSGYDSEAAEVIKGGKASGVRKRREQQQGSRSTKRRRLSHDDAGSDEEEEGSNGGVTLRSGKVDGANSVAPNTVVNEQDNNELIGDVTDVPVQLPHSPVLQEDSPTQIETFIRKENKPESKSKSKDKSSSSSTTTTKPGVIYLSSLPPYLKPSALRNLLTQRGFSPITRLFLTPSSKSKSSSTKSKKSSRQLYSEGWIEFADRKIARRCAESLNAQIVGGPKGGFYHDDLWNMKYLKGMAWSELMAGIREEKREEEGRRDEERRTIARETKRFIEGVEAGRVVEGIKRKRAGKGNSGGGDDRNSGAKNPLRTWRQYEVKGVGGGGGASGRKQSSKDEKMVSDDLREVLGKIF